METRWTLDEIPMENVADDAIERPPKLRNDGGVVRHAWDVYGKKQRDEHHATA